MEGNKKVRVSFSFLNFRELQKKNVRNHRGNKQENEECMYYSHPNTDISVISD